MTMNLIAEQVSKRYFRKTGQANWFEAVRETCLTLSPGSLTVLTGRSGSGKTTLLHMLSGLLPPTSGTVSLDGTDLYSLDDRALSALRNEKIAVIPQGRSGIETLTVRENILLPDLLFHRPPREEEAEAWMRRLRIDHLRDVRPAELSGGELRRMAVARALTRNTPVLLADEPTGDLDRENAETVLAILRDQAEKERKIVLLVTHEQEARAFAGRLLEMDGGTLTEIR